MYQVQYSDKVQQDLAAANKISPSISSRLGELEDNPFARAKETKIETIGSYYVNAGRYCILFEIDQENEIITILSVRTAAFLYKVLKKQLPLIENGEDH